MKSTYNGQVKEIVQLALNEDIGTKDITTGYLISPQSKAEAEIIVNEPGIICGLAVAKQVFQSVNKKWQGKGIRFKDKVKDGDMVKKGEIIAEISGDGRVILTAERVALNFLQRLSGIATLTKRFVDVVNSLNLQQCPKIFDTRKMTPGLRFLEKYAVRCGGGYNHRMGLYDMMLIKDNHLKIIKSNWECDENKETLKELIRGARKSISKNTEIEIEVETISQLKHVIEAGADIIMLDNMNVETLKKAIKMIYDIRKQTLGGEKPIVEVSGGVNLKNIKKIARLGVERISVGNLTCSPNALDISIEVS